MATELTVPEVLDTTTRNAVTRWEVQISYNPDGSPDKIYFTYYVGDFNASGEGINQKVETIAFVDWPAAFKTDVKAVHNKVITDAKNKGYIGVGTDSDDMP